MCYGIDLAIGQVIAPFKSTNHLWRFYNAKLLFLTSSHSLTYAHNYLLDHSFVRPNYSYNYSYELNYIIVHLYEA